MRERERRRERRQRKNKSSGTNESLGNDMAEANAIDNDITKPVRGQYDIWDNW